MSRRPTQRHLMRRCPKRRYRQGLGWWRNGRLQAAPLSNGSRWKTKTRRPALDLAQTTRLRFLELDFKASVLSRLAPERAMRVVRPAESAEAVVAAGAAKG